MIYFISIIFLIAIVVTIMVYVKKTTLEERYSFNLLSTLLQTLFVFITLWITIYTIRSSSSDSKQLFSNLDTFNSKFSKMDTSLNHVSDKLSKLPKQLDDFSESIKSLNNIQSKQSVDFKNNTSILNETINSLHKTVKEYESNIINYSKQLESIVKQTDQQLNIWKEQQRVLLDEMSRKPVLSLSPKTISVKKDTLFINDLVLKNEGNIESFNRVIFLMIPEAFVDSISSSDFIFYHKKDGDIVYRFTPMNTNSEIIAANSSIILPISIKIILKKGSYIIYQIDYYSKYDSGKKIDVIRY